MSLKGGAEQDRNCIQTDLYLRLESRRRQAGSRSEFACWVVCRTEVEGDLQFAADAAAYFSKARTEGRAEVVYALIKDLKKPRGARPGQVYIYFS